MNATSFEILLIVCLTVMHIATLVILFYRDRINQFLDSMSTDVLVSEMYKRGFIAEGGRQIPRAEWQNLEMQPMPMSSLPPPPPMRHLLPPQQQQQQYQRRERHVMPMQDETYLGSAPVDTFQEYLHPLFNQPSACGAELFQDEGAKSPPAWDYASKPRPTGPATCKNWIQIS